MDYAHAAVQRERTLHPAAFLHEVRQHLARYGHPPAPGHPPYAPPSLAPAHLHHIRSWLVRLYSIGADPASLPADRQAAMALGQVAHAALAPYNHQPAGAPWPAGAAAAAPPPADGDLVGSTWSAGGLGSTILTDTTGGDAGSDVVARLRRRQSAAADYGGDIHSMQLLKVSQMVVHLVDGDATESVPRQYVENWLAPLSRAPAPRPSYSRRRP